MRTDNVIYLLLRYVAGEKDILNSVAVALIELANGAFGKCMAEGEVVK